MKKIKLTKDELIGLLYEQFNEGKWMENLKDVDDDMLRMYCVRYRLKAYYLVKLALGDEVDGMKVTDL